MRTPAPRWVGTYQTENLRQAKHRSIPLFYRVYLAALGSAYADGHAPFYVGELAEAVTPVDTETGEVSRSPEPSELRKAIRHAKAMQLLHGSSRPRCLVLPGHVVTRETGRPGDSRCSVAEHRKGVTV